MSENTWLVIGLGNPGTQYQNNRHNVGHLVIDYLLGETGQKLRSHRSGAAVASARLGVLAGGVPGPQVHLAKLGCFMNISGVPTRALADFFGVAPTQILVVHDELDLPPHQLRLKLGGGEGGHNGLRSISQHLGTRDYARLRCGVGRPPGRMDPARYVLADFPSKERQEWQVTVAQAGQVVTDVVTRGFGVTQMELHTNS